MTVVGKGDRGKHAQDTAIDRELLVMSRRGCRVVTLPPHGEISIGRGADCDVALDDAKASRRHAILRIARDVEIVDLGSRNGTVVDGRRLSPHERVTMSTGSVVTLGATVILLQRGTPSAAHTSTAEEYDAAFAEERARAARAGASFAVLLLRVRPVRRPAGGDASAMTTREVLLGQEVESALQRVLTDGDVLSLVDAWSYRILLRGRDEPATRRAARELSARLAAWSVRAEVGAATYPVDGTTRRALEHAAEAALREVGYDGPVTVRANAPPATPDLDAVVERVAGSNISVLLLGETGVGKEVMAGAVHARSPRAAAPFVGINCAAFSEALFESELFGHERGAFTGADRAKPGLLEVAEGGTVFLDEVGEMPPSLQAKLLRVLERREVLRVGSVQPRPIDVRIVSATNLDLEAEIAARRFRQDLYFRLNGISITIPPLRQRAGEIEPLARHFLETGAAAIGRRPVPALAPDALEALHAHDWPGNIRELRNVIERALVLSVGPTIRRDDLQLATGPAQRVAESRPAGSALASGEREERERIVLALERCVGNQTYAAEMLGISRRTLVSRIAKYGIPRPRTRPTKVP
jgi:DNA-binding NtrC family response regulator